MKKLFLLMAAGISVSTAFAQYGNNSVVFNNFHAAPAGKIATDVAPHKFNANGTANKTTGGAKEGWYSYVNVMASSNIKGWYSNVYNDTTTRSFDGTTYFFNKLHGTGFSFDAYSSVWDNDFVDINSIPGFSIAKTQGYTLDSFYFSGYYNRLPYNNYVDTLFIDLAKTGAANTYSIQYGPDASLAAYSIDSVVRNFNATYDADNNRLSDSINLAAAGSLVRITIPLTATFFADSTGSRSHSQAVKVPGGLAVGPNQGVVAYVHYKSGHTYPFGMNVDSVNCWRSYTYELAGEDTNPYQVKKERNAGLVSTWESRYAPYFTFQGHKIIIPTTLYGATSGNDWPDYGFYVKCADCENAGVANVTGIIGSVKAYPNPANSEVILPVALTKAASVKVSLINTLGQNVAAQDLGKVAAGQTATATFSTSALPAGIYIYNVNADGQVMTGRVVVAH